MTDLTRFLVQGKGRDSVDGFHPEFSNALASMFAAAPPEIQAQLQIGSGYRSPERQAQLYSQALKKYGSEAAARKWVAPPGRSQHNHGNAADLRYMNPAAREWAHANAGRFGLAFPMAHENWHIELASARGGHKHQSPPAPAPTQAIVNANAVGAPSTAGGATHAAPPVPFMNAQPEPAGGTILANMFLGGGVPQFGAARQAEADEAATKKARRQALYDTVADLYA